MQTTNTPQYVGRHAAAFHTAQADRVAAELRDSRCCNVFDPCDHCSVGRIEVPVRRHIARVELAR